MSDSDGQAIWYLFKKILIKCGLSLHLGGTQDGVNVRDVEFVRWLVERPQEGYIDRADKFYQQEAAKIKGLRV